MDTAANYRSGMFDGKADITWLSQGWRALRLYGRRAKLAIEEDDTATKIDMIHRANELLNIMSGIVDTGKGTTLGPALMTIYTALRYTLLRANLENNATALDDFETALALLDQDMTKLPESAAA